jgi:hypothetical protein
VSIFGDSFLVLFWLSVCVYLRCTFGDLLDKPFCVWYNWKQMGRGTRSLGKEIGGWTQTQECTKL